MSIDLRLPNINAKTDSEKIAQLTKYIYQLTEQLTFSLNTIEHTFGNTNDIKQHFSATTSSAKTEEEKLEEAYSSVKSMIIKSADFTKSVSDVIHTQLDGSYIAKSEFGDYLENTTVEIDGNSVGFTQLYSYTAGIRSDFADFDVNNQSYIKTGLLYYNNSTPVYGVGVGILSSTTDVNGKTVIDRSGLLATYTADEIAFWCNDDKVASIKPTEVYFPNGILKAYGATITGDIKGGTININDNFIVDKYGNVQLNGNITWGVSSSPTQVLYAQSYDNKPTNGTSFSDYPKDGKAFENIAIDDNNNIHFGFYGTSEIDLSGSETSLSATLDDAYSRGISERNIEAVYDEGQNITTLTRNDTNNTYQIKAQITDAYNKNNILLIESLKCSGGWNGVSFNIKNLPVTFSQSRKVLLSYYYDNPGETGLVGNYMTLVLKVNGTYYGVKSDNIIVSAQWNSLTFDFSSLITSVNENYKIEEAILYFYDVMENGTTGQYYSSNYDFWVGNKIGISELIFENPNELGSLILSGWHQTYTNGDIYASYTYNGGNTWGSPVRIVGKDGINGKDASVNYENVFNALTDNGKKQGMFYSGTDGNVYINASYIKAGKLYFGNAKTYYIDVNNTTYINLPKFKVTSSGAEFSGTLSAPKGNIGGFDIDEYKISKTETIEFPSGIQETISELNSVGSMKFAWTSRDYTGNYKSRYAFVCLNGRPYIVANRVGDGSKPLPALIVIMQDGLDITDKRAVGFAYPQRFEFYVKPVTINRGTEYEETFYTLAADQSYSINGDGEMLGLWSMDYK